MRARKNRILPGVPNQFSACAGAANPAARGPLNRDLSFEFGHQNSVNSIRKGRIVNGFSFNFTVHGKIEPEIGTTPAIRMRRPTPGCAKVAAKCLRNLGPLGVTAVFQQILPFC